MLVLTLFNIYIDRSGMETAHGSMVCCLSTNVAMMTNTLAMCPFYDDNYHFSNESHLLGSDVRVICVRMASVFHIHE